MTNFDKEMKELERQLNEAEEEVKSCAELCSPNSSEDEDDEEEARRWNNEWELELRAARYNEAVEKRNDVKRKIYQKIKEQKDIEIYEKFKKEGNTFREGKLVSEILSDKLNPDIFDRKKLANNIANEICNPMTTSPHNISVLGDWGAGKTTFFKYIKDEIKKIDGDNKRIKIIDFNAAEYSSKVLDSKDDKHVEQQWCNLLRVLLDSYENEHPVIGGIRYNRIRLLNLKTLGRAGLYALVVLVNLLIIFGINLLLNLTKVKGFDYKSLNTVAGLSLGLIIFIPIVYKSISLAIPLSNKIEGFTKLPDYTDILGNRTKIYADLEILLKAWVPEDDDRIIIFVDDCDRCSESGIMELFEAMHLFLDLKKVFFVFAIDEELLRKSVSSLYGGNSSDATADRFLQKYVSNKIVLNKPNYGNLIGSLREIIEPSKKEQKEYPGIHCLLEQEYYIFISFLPILSYPTPRCVKQVLNNVVRLKNIYMSETDLAHSVQFETIMAWYMMNYFYTADYYRIKNSISKSNEFFKLGEKCGSLIMPDLKESYIWKELRVAYIGEIVLIEEILAMLINKSSIAPIETILNNTVDAI